MIYWPIVSAALKIYVLFNSSLSLFTSFWNLVLHHHHHLNIHHQYEHHLLTLVPQWRLKSERRYRNVSAVICSSLNIWKKWKTLMFAFFDRAWMGGFFEQIAFFNCQKPILFMQIPNMLVRQCNALFQCCPFERPQTVWIQFYGTCIYHSDGMQDLSVVWIWCCERSSEERKTWWQRYCICMPSTSAYQFDDL